MCVCVGGGGGGLTMTMRYAMHVCVRETQPLAVLRTFMKVIVVCSRCNGSAMEPFTEKVF